MSCVFDYGSVRLIRLCSSPSRSRIYPSTCQRTFQIGFFLREGWCVRYGVAALVTCTFVVFCNKACQRIRRRRNGPLRQTSCMCESKLFIAFLKDVAYFGYPITKTAFVPVELLPSLKTLYMSVFCLGIDRKRGEEGKGCMLSILIICVGGVEGGA
ncbi:hypothetical protein BDN72DRAFT_554416 [Pluteus cervinus]|uniref:Uncharacterized protein n=1 Tax=Pluteus cervinus TaxID=181527 RepID=A0ACD3AXV0_9AGAR|nr:hypothetical protein BDN72DRAFT_554416 [Pluteus cervinus]